MTIFLRSLVGVVTASLVALTGCEAGRGAGDTNDTAAAQLAARLADALSGHSLAGVAMAEPGQAEAFADALASLERYPVEVTAHDIRRTDASAEATLHWRWELDAGEWTYDTSVPLAEHDGRWVVNWGPSSLEPSLGEHEVLDVSRITPERGDVLGADDAPIVTRRPVVRYGLDRSQVSTARVARSAARIARALDVEVAGFRAAAVAAGPKAFVEALVLREQEARDTVPPSFARIPGALAVRDELPLAPTREFAAALLGRVGPATAEIVEGSEGRVRAGDLVGLSGLQQRYDGRLAGSPGLEVRAVPREPCATWPECPAQGTPRVLKSWPVKPGRALRLTLDQDLQLAAESALASAGGEDAPASALVAIRPSTGEVLAAANGPGNDGLNAATAGQYAPGSTFKIVTALALLRAGVAPDETVSCPATLEVDGKRFKNYDDYPVDRLGDISFQTAIANSCNTALIGERARLQPEDLTEASAALGLGVDHDLGFPAYLGQAPAPSGETEKAADLIGQGKVLASPLAMAAVAASVSAGRVVVPRLVERGVPSTAEPARPLTESEAAALSSMMRAVVTEGSGGFLADVPGEVGAKTGTAEYGEPAGDGSLSTHAWMIATRGDLAVAVFVETGQSGSQTAGPLLEEFLR